MPTCEEELKWKTRAVDLMLAIDQIRDSAKDEREMTAAIVTTLADAVEAELCLLCLHDDDVPEGLPPGQAEGEGELQLRAVVDRAAVYTPATERYFRELAVRATHLAGAEFVDTQFALADLRQMYCLAAPLRVGKESLGALLLLNADRPFNGGEHDLVRAAVSITDTAMQHQRTLHELHRRQKELETIYRIDRIRDRNLEFQVMLNTILADVCRTIASETGFLMLYDKTGNELELRATTDQNLFSSAEAAALIRSIADEAVQRGHPICRRYAEGPITSIIGVPLILRGKFIGVLGVVNHKGRPYFARSDFQLLHAIGSQMDTAIFESMQNLRLREAFGQCVGPQVMDRLLTISDRDLLSSEKLVVTTLFSDIRGFTSMSEKIESELLRSVLNDHLSAMTDLVLKYEGTLDKYIGDCVMCFFNAPERQPDHALRAVRLAVEMQQAHRAVIERWRGRVPLPPIGIGVSTGETILGNFGSVRRLEYTAIGPDVNLSARLCGAADGHQILIAGTTYAEVKDYLLADELPPLALKGIEGPIRCWSVRAIK
jgi:class 3 adenylate cyclase/GAF domain-containing protein